MHESNATSTDRFADDQIAERDIEPAWRVLCEFVAHGLSYPRRDEVSKRSLRLDLQQEVRRWLSTSLVAARRLVVVQVAVFASHSPTCSLITLSAFLLVVCLSSTLKEACTLCIAELSLQVSRREKTTTHEQGRG
jgi:hypothetical protein